MKVETLVALVFLCKIEVSYSREQIEIDIVRKWAEKISEELKQLSNFVTRREEAIQSFRDVHIQGRNGKILATEISQRLADMMKKKEKAVEKIVLKAEKTAFDHHSDDVKYLQFNNMTMETAVIPNKRFHGTPVNTCHSSVYVPVNVSANVSVVLNPIKWSADIDSVFTENYARDPSLSWQYFGSSIGFMRQFPATQWTEETPDRYDCRTRPWFTQAASSSTDVVILVDNSGSMSGVKKEVARHVVNHILDTLGDNDFVNVFSFTDKMDLVVPCFSEKMMVQANLLNVLALKEGMKTLRPSDIANLTEVLPVAFNLLKEYRVQKRGANCNQAIMLITDNLKENHSEIFETYNRKGYEIPVRMFTFFLGDDSSDNDVHLKWIACHNRGHFIQVRNVSDARNQVYTYLAVEARPMVLRKHHPFVWSTMYADVEDIDMNKQLERFKERYSLQKYFRLDNENAGYDYNEGESSCKYRLVMSVSMPVYDKRETAIIPVREYFPKEEKSPVPFQEKIVERKIAHLLGVAGVDVPIEEVVKHFTPHKIGVNGYAFLVTNNGYVLAHPNLRPSYYGILKPIYNNIDVIEIEMIDDNKRPREVNQQFLHLRDEILRLISGQQTLRIKNHYDCMRRVSVFERTYHYVRISDTPFTLVLSLPTSHEPVKLHEKAHTQGINFAKFFRGEWNIHPEWKYCYYYYNNNNTFNTPEKELLHFVNRVHHPGWKWEVPAYRSSKHGDIVQANTDAFFCDKELVSSVMHHAKNTEWFLKPLTGSLRTTWFNYNSRFNITLRFLSTYSGFTRWRLFSEKERDFTEKNIKAIDETWYKRSVELNKDSEESFLYSVPFYSGTDDDHTVTVTQAIYPRKGHKSHRYPLAVTGYRFSLYSLNSLLKNATYMCPQGSPCRVKTCSSEELDCYILDNNGYIIVSENYEDNAGKFFGEVHGHIMELMVKEHIYRRIPIYDYQSMCLRPDSNGNVASYIITPFNSVKWIISKLIWIVYNMWWGDGVYAALESEDISSVEEPLSLHDMMAQNIRPELCDTQTNLYLLTNEKKVYNRRSENCTRPYVIQKIADSNMVLVVISSLCPEDEMALNTRPVEITYDQSRHCLEQNGSCDSLACFKANYLNFARRLPKHCYNYHQDVSMAPRECLKI